MPLSPSQTRLLLDQLGHHPRKALGQNFLIDGNIVRKSISLAGLKTGDLVVEVGPGLGTLTEAMLDMGCRVHAVELDPTLAHHLAERFASVPDGQFNLLIGDAVAYPHAGLKDLEAAFKVVANLPYAITTPWLESLIGKTLPREMVLMMQKEAAARVTATHGSKAFGAVSIFIGAAYDRIGTVAVSRSCFHPVPGVDSVLLHLRLKDHPFRFAPPTRERIRTLFTHRRKQISNLLRNPDLLSRWLAACPDSFSPSSRPEDIPTHAWIVFDGLLDPPPAQPSNKSA
jgi:16S rRNA (adenine1518-N6/adenine1519-N6)-dimethyltransferase